MWAYIIRRLLLAIPTLLGVTLISFMLFNVVGDPALIQLGEKASEQQIENKRKEMGLDRGYPAQYLDFLKQTVTLDFGDSWSKKRPVGEVLLEGLAPSISITLPAFLIALLLSISLSLFCAYYRDSIVDRTTVVLAVAGMSISSLAYIIFGQYILAYQWNLMPVYGYVGGLSGIAFLLLPWTIWVALSIGSEVRFYRTALLEEMSQDYVRTAASKGVGTKRILFRHILKNAMIPIITRTVITIPFLFVGSLLLEKFFGIPGLGSLSIEAIDTQDFPVIKAVVVYGSILFIFFSLLSDVLYAIVDPRVRLQ